MKTVEIHPVHTTYHTSKYLLINMALILTIISFFSFDIYSMIYFGVKVVSIFEKKSVFCC